jgi:hypothetical protein
MPLPHLSKIKQASLRLSLKACAELADNRPDEALADVKLILSLGDSIRSEPFLISLLVRIPCLDIAIQPVWEGLAEHRWTDAQLQELQRCFSSYDLLADCEQALKGERALTLLEVDDAKMFGLGRLPYFYVRQTPFKKELLFLFGRVIPSGWYYQEKVNYCNLFDAQRNGVVDLATKMVSPSRSKSNDQELLRQVYGGLSPSTPKVILHHRFIAATLLRALSRVPSSLSDLNTNTYNKYIEYIFSSMV